MLILTQRAGLCRGFTLIELMIVVAIMAVLMGIALPAYQQQSLRANRAAAQAEMLEIAGLQQQYLLSNRRYMDAATLAASGYQSSSLVARHYQSSLTLNTEDPIPRFELRLTPIGPQQRDGWLQLDSAGRYSSQFERRWWR